MFQIIFNRFKNLFVNKNTINLGRWNYKNNDKYMEWANYDNCFTSMHDLKKNNY